MQIDDNAGHGMAGGLVATLAALLVITMAGASMPDLIIWLAR
ncbi:hypothetical protein [Pseudomonas sp. PS02288]|nr:hypothetical protein [Pseudomonas sp. PS02288]